MKVLGSFNNVSEKLKQELIKPIKSGSVVHLQLLNGIYDPTTKRECFGASRSIRLSDRIYDPYNKQVKNENGEIEYKGDYVDIGVPDIIKDGRVERCKKFWVESIANGIPGNGQFSLIGGDIAQMETYEFLCLSNGSKNNPYRDQTKAPDYEIIDVEAMREAEKEKTRKELKARLTRFAKENPEEAEELIGSIPKKKAEEVIN